MATNLQTFSGEVEIPEGNLQLKRILELSTNNASTSNTGILFSRNLGSTSNSNVIVYFDEATDSLRFGHTMNASSDSEITMDTANVLNMNVFGDIEASFFKGDGGLLSNLVTDLQSVTENGADTDQTLILTNAVTGIDVQTGNVNVAGNVTASIFFGDGGLLSNITQTLQGITEIGNTTSIGLEFNNVTTGFVTTSNVGIVNTAPQHNFSVGSNLYVHDTASNVLTVEGNVSAHKLTLGQIEITPAYGLENVTNISNLAYDTLLFQNASTAFVTTAMAGIGLQPDSSDVGTSGLHVDGHLRLGGPAGTDENSDIYLRTAGQLNIESNDTDTDNQYTALALRAGNANESNIIVEGALSDTSKQYISFGVRNQERMKIDREGNVTVGYASTTHKLDVAGSANVTTLNASNLVINTVSISVQYDLDQILENGNVSTNVITVGKCTVTDPTLAQTASNLVTWNASTKEFEDSGGLISNKLAIVSEQPPAALTGDSTVVDGHGRYKVTTSLEAASRQAYKVFDKTIGQGTDGWSSGALGAYNSDGTYAGSNSLASVNGEWIKLELPYKATLRHIALASRDGSSYSAMPEDFSIVASNDDSTWVVLKSVNGQAWSSTDYVNFVVDASTAYKYYAIVVELTNNNFAQIGEWKLFTETFTVDAGVVSTTAASGLDVGYTEHPVEPMTDYKTYVEGHGTYEASASSYDTGNSLYPWEAFDHLTASRWSINSPGNLYNLTTGEWDQTAINNYPHVYTDDVGGTRYAGHWLQIKLPYAITLSHSNIHPTNTLLNRAPKDGVILGSNDGENWYKLTQFTGKTYTSATWTRIDVNATTPYQYYRMCITKVTGGTTFTELTEWRLFAEKPVTRMENVHISGDLSSETLQTGYIKWPRKSLKANESEGYVASASSVYNTQNFEAWHAFEDKPQYSGSWGPAWLAKLYTFIESTGAPDTANCATFDNTSCEWIQITQPEAIHLSSFHFKSRNLAETPKSGSMYGSNDDFNTYDKLVSFSGNTQQSAKVDVHTTKTYKSFRLVISEIIGYHYPSIDELQLFEAATGVGAAPTSAKLQVAGSLGMAKGSEFFAGDDVVMELPKHDRPLVKYPEVAMAKGQTGVGGYTQDGYTIEASSDYGGGHITSNAFDHVITSLTTSDAWLSGQNTYGDDGLASSGTSKDTFEGIDGSWIGIKLPRPIKLSHVNLYNFDRASNLRPPKTGIVWAKKSTDSEWYRLNDFSVSQTGRGELNVVNVNSNTRYDWYRVQFTEMVIDGSYINAVALQEIELYGTEEGDTSVDVVHRSVPNKPGQQHLEVYWDANDSNSYSFADSSNVYDLSGSAVKGTITGTNGFDAEYNAWVFDGSGDYIESPTLSLSGDAVHSISVWFNASDTTSFKTVANITNTTTNGGQLTHSGIRVHDGKLNGFFYADDLTSDATINTDVWYHAVTTYKGGGSNRTNRKMYLNGVEIIDFSFDGTSDGNLNLSSPTLCLGRDQVRNSNQFSGKIANFRLYGGKALNADQVRELYEYDAERFGHRQNLVALHKGNLGVGVSHPTSRFEVAGTETLQEYPPRAMTGFENYIEGHGVFRVSQSSDVTPNGVGGAQAWKVFDDINDATNDNYWNPNHASTDHRYGGTDGIYTGINTFQANSDSSPVGGEWMKIEFPHKFKLNNLVVQGRYNYTSAPGGGEQNPTGFRIIGSNDDANWYILKTVTNQTGSQYPGTTNTIPDYHPPYKYYVFHVTHNAGSIAMSVGGLQFFGTPAPSGLEDGHLTLGKALTLPRVSGHPAGAETPRAESLVVHYDTTVDSVVSGSTVVDVSGNGINGTLTNGAAYSSTDRAFTFDGTNDYILSALSGQTGQTYSVSTWAKITSGYILFHFGHGTTLESFGVNFNTTTGRIGVFIWDTATIHSTIDSFVIGEWFHIAVVHTSGNVQIYINGVFNASGTYTGPSVIPSNPYLSLGIHFNDEFASLQSSGYLQGSISNFKIWGGVALTADEVAMEYALGRTGKSLNLTDTALCLGGTVPRAQLDVRGSALFQGVGIANNNDSTRATTRGLSIMLEDADIDNTDAATIFNYPVQIHNTYPQANSVANGREVGLCFSLYDSAFPGDSGSYTPGAAITHERTNAWSKGKLHFKTKQTNTSNSDCVTAMTISDDGNVGIGVTNPVAALDFGSSVRNRIINLWGSDTGGEDSTNFYGFGVNSSTLRYNVATTGDVHKFYGGSTEYGYVNNATGFVNSFTGQHKSFPHESLFGKTSDDLCGLIVSASGEYISINDKVPQKGQGAIQVSEAIPTVKLSTSEKDKKVFGVISDVEDVETSQRHDHYGAFVSTFEKEPGDSRIYVNSIGEGAMWVTDINGPLESGDYITTSNVAGYGQRQESEFLANYTVAKITMDCDFNPVTQPIQIILKELANVNYWVKTTYSNVTPEEYSNLAEENRTTEDETYYTKDVERKYTYKPTVTVTGDDAWDDVYIFPSDVTYGEWSNLEANVQNTYTLTYTRDDFDGSRYEKTTVSNVTAEDEWDVVHIEPTITYAEYSNLEANVQNTYSVTYTNSTTTSVTAEEYNNLEANVQGEYTLVYWKIVTEEVTDPEGADEHTRTIYKKIEREETKNEPTEDTGEWGLDIRQEPVNVLDEHGQLQWEDDPSGATEKAYKIRHLDASGQQTDEANAVHIAAFVGCTYHCG
jgi:hypothetical protein